MQRVQHCTDYSNNLQIQTKHHPEPSKISQLPTHKPARWHYKILGNSIASNQSSCQTTKVLSPSFLMLGRIICPPNVWYKCTILHWTKSTPSPCCLSFDQITKVGPIKVDRHLWILLQTKSRTQPNTSWSCEPHHSTQTKHLYMWILDF